MHCSSKHVGPPSYGTSLRKARKVTSFVVVESHFHIDCKTGNITRMQASCGPPFTARFLWAPKNITMWDLMILVMWLWAIKVRLYLVIAHIITHLMRTWNSQHPRWFLITACDIFKRTTRSYAAYWVCRKNLINIKVRKYRCLSTLDRSGFDEIVPRSKNWKPVENCLAQNLTVVITSRTAPANVQICPISRSERLRCFELMLFLKWRDSKRSGMGNNKGGTYPRRG